MRKTIQPFYLLFMLFFSLQLYATPPAQLSKKFLGFADGTRGMGFMLGEPTSVNYSLFTGWKSAWIFSAGYSFDRVVAANIDRLWYFYNTEDKLRNADFWNSLLFYSGLGARVGMGLAGSDPNDSLQLGLRVTGGVEYIFINSPWAIRIEFVPTFFVKAKNVLNVSAGVGFSYYWFDGAKPAPAIKSRSAQPTAAPTDTSEFD